MVYKKFDIEKKETQQNYINFMTYSDGKNILDIAQKIKLSPQTKNT